MVDKNVNRRHKLDDKVNIWEQKLKEHREKQLINPFSEWEGASHREKLSLENENYGKPVQGSFTELRGKQAHEHVSSEILTLLRIIKQNGKPNEGNDSTEIITFGRLFEIYTNISNKVVGMLLRARKYGFVNFVGEILFQGRDTNVEIWLTRSGKDVLEAYNS
eukprot:gene10778-11931_t